MGMTLALPVQALTREAFAPFGDVISTEGAKSFPVDNGRTERYHALARVEILGGDDDAIVSIFRGQPLAPPIIATMERYPLGSQALMPLIDLPYWVVVAPPGEFDPTAICAFLAEGKQGVNYRPGTWHAPLLPLFPNSDFLVVDRRGSDQNVDTVTLDQPRHLVKASSF